MDIKPKKKVKTGIDLGMTVLLLLLMAYPVTGQNLHEWFGAGMLALFIAHHILNAQWYKNLRKRNVQKRRNYKPAKLLRTVINFATLVDILLLGYSGIVMSRHLFAFLPIHRGMAVARRIHLAGSYWGFVLMGVHLGLHWGMALGIYRRLFGGKQVPGFVWLLRLLAVAIAGFGAVCFGKMDILSYLFLKAEFAFFDFEKSVLFVLAENFAMLGLWVFLGYYAAKMLDRVSASKSNGKERVYEED